MSDSRIPTEKTAIIVSHGQPSDPDPAEQDLERLADSVASLADGWCIKSATLAKTGALQKVSSETAPAPVIYPLFMTDGWFTKTMLPKRLNRKDAMFLPPMGIDPALPDVAQRYLTSEMAARGWKPAECALIIASHGSGKSRNSARDTEIFASSLSNRFGFRDMKIGYIEEPTFLHNAARNMGEQSLCLPFFARNGGHVQEDIPEALDKAGFSGLRLAPIGTHNDIPRMIASALLKQAS